jgi:putative ABC transport system permease protein
VAAIISFSVALTVALFVLATGLRLGLIRAVEPFDLIVGARGSQYQLLLNTVFLQDVPIGNIKWKIFAELSDDARVELAVPLAFGDSYRGYPVIGTTLEILGVRVKATSPPWLRIAEGRWYESGFEAVLGSQAATETGLGVGDKFKTAHGGAYGEEHDGDFKVVGIIKPTFSPYDRAVFVPLQTVWDEHRHSDEDEAEYNDVTAVMIRPRSYADAYNLAALYQNATGAQLIFPATTAIRLFSLMGRGEAFLSVIVRAVCGCALVTTLLALFWSSSARHRERELLHILGATRGDLIFISWFEGTATLLIGAVTGEILGRLGTAAAFSALGSATAIHSSVPLTLQEFLAPLVILTVGSMGGLFAAWRDTRET